MNTNRLCLASAVALLAGWWAVPAMADQWWDAIEACRVEPDANKRLACFDATVAARDASAAHAAATGAAAPASAPPAKTPEERFGFRGEIAKEEVQKRREKESGGLVELRSKVARLTAGGFGGYVVTLENGQVWEQRNIDSRFSLAKGDEVIIKAAALGSFLLIGPDGRSARFGRVK